MQIEYSEVRACRTSRELNQKIDEIFKRAKPDDPPFLSDAMVNIEFGGQHIMLALGEKYEEDRDLPMDEKFTWRIQMIRDEWGNPPKPGEKVQIKRQRPLTVRQPNGEKLPIPGRELSAARADGTYDQKYTTTNEYTIDEKGCVRCAFRDAVYLLTKWGIHSTTKTPLMGYRPLGINRVTGEPFKNVREISNAPRKTPDGDMKHVWYHRFQELTKEQYDKLPKIKVTNETKRGVA